MGIIKDLFRASFERTPRPEEMGANIAKPAENQERAYSFKRPEKPKTNDKPPFFEGKLCIPIKKLEEKAKEARNLEIPGVHWSRQKEARVEAVHNLIEKFYQKQGIKSEFIKPADLKRAVDDFTEKELGEIKRKGTHNEIEQAKKTAHFLSQFINYGA